MSLVLDASAVVELILRSKQGEAVEKLIADPAETLHAPHLVDLEVTQVLRRLVRSGKISVGRADLARVAFQMLSIARYDHATFLSRIWQLRDVLTSYDASYVALAESLGAPIVTLDRPMAEGKHGALIIRLSAPAKQ